MRMTDAGGKMMNRYVEAFTDLMHSSSINLMRMVSDVDNKRVFLGMEFTRHEIQDEQQSIRGYVMACTQTNNFQFMKTESPKQAY